jgi:hypothetical protein
VPLSIFGERAKGIRLWYNLISFIYDQRGRKNKRALMIPFLAIHAKGGESMSPKQKDRTTTNFKNLVFQRVFSIGILLCSKGGRKQYFKNCIYQNPLDHKEEDLI